MRQKKLNKLQVLGLVALGLLVMAPIYLTPLVGYSTGLLLLLPLVVLLFLGTLNVRKL